MDPFQCFYIKNLSPSSTILKGYLYALFHSGKYDELFKVMSNNCFEDSYHTELTELWFSFYQNLIKFVYKYKLTYYLLSFKKLLFKNIVCVFSLICLKKVMRIILYLKNYTKFKKTKQIFKLNIVKVWS